MMLPRWIPIEKFYYAIETTGNEKLNQGTENEKLNQGTDNGEPIIL
jgi:hypothetical protein